jgi:hypothetical protein
MPTNEQERKRVAKSYFEGGPGRRQKRAQTKGIHRSDHRTPSEKKDEAKFQALMDADLGKDDSPKTPPEFSETERGFQEEAAEKGKKGDLWQEGELEYEDEIREGLQGQRISRTLEAIDADRAERADEYGQYAGARDAMREGGIGDEDRREALQGVAEGLAEEQQDRREGEIADADRANAALYQRLTGVYKQKMAPETGFQGVQGDANLSADGDPYQYKQNEDGTFEVTGVDLDKVPDPDAARQAIGTKLSSDNEILMGRISTDPLYSGDRMPKTLPGDAPKGEMVRRASGDIVPRPKGEIVPRPPGDIVPRPPGDLPPIYDPNAVRPAPPRRLAQADMPFGFLEQAQRTGQVGPAMPSDIHRLAGGGTSEAARTYDALGRPVTSGSVLGMSDEYIDPIPSDIHRRPVTSGPVLGMSDEYIDPIPDTTTDKPLPIEDVKTPPPAPRGRGLPPHLRDIPATTDKPLPIEGPRTPPPAASQQMALDFSGPKGEASRATLQNATNWSEFDAAYRQIAEAQGKDPEALAELYQQMLRHRAAGTVATGSDMADLQARAGAVFGTVDTPENAAVFAKFQELTGRGTEFGPRAGQVWSTPDGRDLREAARVPDAPVPASPNLPATMDRGAQLQSVADDAVVKGHIDRAANAVLLDDQGGVIGALEDLTAEVDRNPGLKQKLLTEVGSEGAEVVAKMGAEEVAKTMLVRQMAARGMGGALDLAARFAVPDILLAAEIPYAAAKGFTPWNKSTTQLQMLQRIASPEFGHVAGQPLNMAMVQSQGFNMPAMRTMDGVTPGGTIPMMQALQEQQGLREDLYARGVIDQDVFVQAGGTQQSLDAYGKYGYTMTPKWDTSDPSLRPIAGARPGQF